jgi:hypothetical protein
LAVVMLRNSPEAFGDPAAERLHTLRYLSNQLKLSLVCVGIAEARDAINGDVLLARRFDVMTLPRWSANEKFEQLVRNLPPCRPSNLTPRGLRRILRVTGGVTARVFRLLNCVAITVIEDGTEGNHRCRC